MNKIITQVITVAASREKVFQEVLLWGESVWWPKNSLMQFKNLTGRIEKGTVYKQKVKLPFGPSWHSRNVEINREECVVKRQFFNGMFVGFEEIRVLSKDKKEVCQVRYEFNYQVRGRINFIFWQVLSKSLHIKNIDLILKTMRNYLEVK